MLIRRHRRNLGWSWVGKIERPCLLHPIKCRLLNLTSLFTIQRVVYNISVLYLPLFTSI